MEEPRRVVPRPQPYPSQLPSSLLDEDLKLRPKSELETRAANIQLSHVPIINQRKGRVRVARNIASASSSPGPGLPSTMAPAHPEFAQNYSISNRTGHKSPQQDSVRGQSMDIVGLRSLAPSVRISQFQTFTYEYKPPAAAKYFLWDSTAIDEIKEISSRTVVPARVIITDTARKSLSIQLMKRSLLIAANSSTISSSACGFFLGKVTELDHERVLILDRFDATTENPKSLMHDILVKVLDQNGPCYLDEQYVVTLSVFKESLDSNPTEQLDLAFPITCHVASTDNEITRIVEQMVVPNYDLTLVPIHPLRIVYTELSQSLASGKHKAKFGYLSIDQARQLYFLSDTDPKIYTIPLVGIWCQVEDVSDIQLHSLIIRFVMNTKICKLDTGKDHLLICQFREQAPSRPTCYQCNYTVCTLNAANRRISIRYI
jgi:hypothetical protein